MLPQSHTHEFAAKSGPEFAGTIAGENKKALAAVASRVKSIDTLNWQLQSRATAGTASKMIHEAEQLVGDLNVLEEGLNTDGQYAAGARQFAGNEVPAWITQIVEEADRAVHVANDMQRTQTNTASADISQLADRMESVAKRLTALVSYLRRAFRR